MKIQELYALYLRHPNISTDSRTVKPGCIFFALSGVNFDGNAYVHSALEQGASFAVSNSRELSESDSRIIYSEDTLLTLQTLAKFHVEQLNIPILAITGTNGKTTTKELIASCLSKKYTVGFTQGNLNNHIGVPLTVLSFGKDTQIGVVEMGANHQYEIDTLCQIAQPGFGLITNIGTAHIEGFGSQEIIVKTKTELYRYIQHYGGIIFQNSDDELLLANTVNNVERHCYSQNMNTGVTGKILHENPFVEIEISYPIGDQKLVVKTKLVGKYNAYNCLAASTVANYFGVPLPEIQDALENYTPKNNRSQLLKTERNTLILDAYNANPTSLSAALETLHNIKALRKVAIIGDMLELGEISAREHRSVLQKAVEYQFDTIITVGERFAAHAGDLHILNFANAQQLSEFLSQNKLSDSLILLKASRGIGLEAVVGEL